MSHHCALYRSYMIDPHWRMSKPKQKQVPQIVWTLISPHQMLKRKQKTFTKRLNLPIHFKNIEIWPEQSASPIRISSQSIIIYIYWWHEKIVLGKFDFLSAIFVFNILILLFVQWMSRRSYLLFFKFSILLNQFSMFIKDIILIII